MGAATRMSKIENRLDDFHLLPNNECLLTHNQVISKTSGRGISSGQDMNRVTFSVVAIMLLASATLCRLS
jgi:hypothetical protein